jgi:hypothetical protein
LTVMFVNEFPSQTIDLYWENPSFDDSHPGRRRFEARIPPRGGWHSTETFTGHGKFECSSSGCKDLSCVKSAAMSHSLPPNPACAPSQNSATK